MAYKNPDRERHRMNRQRARQLGIGFELSFDDWLAWWKDTGHFHERGRRRGQYVMARIDRTAPYRLGNLRCALAETVPAETGRLRAIRIVPAAPIGASP